MKKRLLFTANTLDIGGIEKALINLLNNIDYSKYEVTLILEKKEGLFLKDLNKNVILKELKVSSSKIVPLRKIINFSRKLLFKLKNKNKYDFSCCYATYSYSGNVLARIASKNSMLYVHNNYKDLYKGNKKKIHEFFDTRNINEFKYITFVSNESRDDLLKYYPNIKNKAKVFNNFIDTKDIKKLSEEKIEEVKPNNTLFVYVGRLDEDQKKLSRAINLMSKIKNATFWIIGNGPEKERYVNQINDLKLNDRVFLLGPRKNPYPYIKQADYILLTSDYEGFPVTYLEALVLNKKIITTIPVSDDKIDIRDYASIISKDEKKMVNEVKNILKESSKNKTISLDKIQEERIKDLEKIFNEVSNG